MKNTLVLLTPFLVFITWLDVCSQQDFLKEDFKIVNLLTNDTLSLDEINGDSLVHDKILEILGEPYEIDDNIFDESVNLYSIMYKYEHLFVKLYKWSDIQIYKADFSASGGQDNYILISPNGCELYIGMTSSEVQSCFPEEYLIHNSGVTNYLGKAFMTNGVNSDDSGLTIYWDTTTQVVKSIKITTTY